MNMATTIEKHATAPLSDFNIKLPERTWLIDYQAGLPVWETQQSVPRESTLHTARLVQSMLSKYRSLRGKGKARY